MSISAILETTARLTRRHFRMLVALATLFLTPTVVLSALAGFGLFEAIAPAVPRVPGEQVAFTTAQVEAILRASAIVLGVSLLASVAGALLAVASSHVVARDYIGSPTNIGDGARHAMKRLLPVLAAMILNLGAILGVAILGVLAATAVISGLGRDASGGGPGVFVALIVGVTTVLAVLILAARWTLAVPVLALEQVGPIQALRRSWRLTASAVWRTIGLTLLVVLIVGVLGSVVTEVLGFILADLPLGATSSGAIVVRIVIGSSVAIISAPILPVALTVLYFDLRVRREALEIGPHS